MPARCLLLTAALLLLAPEAGAANKRRPDCAGVQPERTRAICTAIAASFTWQWMGHAIVAPGYKPDLQTIGKAFCRAKIARADQPALEQLRKSTDWRLESAAGWLLNMLDAQEGKSGEPENSVFNPANQAYVLRQGCPSAP